MKEELNAGEFNKELREQDPERSLVSMFSNCTDLKDLAHAYNLSKFR